MNDETNKAEVALLMVLTTLQKRLATAKEQADKSTPGQVKAYFNGRYHAYQDMTGAVTSIVTEYNKAKLAHEQGTNMPESRCPKCGDWVSNWDGLPVASHDICGYCSHGTQEEKEGRMICSWCGEDCGGIDENDN